MKNIIIINEDGNKKEITESNYAEYDTFFRFIKQIEWDHEGQHLTCGNSYQVYLIPQKQKLAVLYMEENPDFPPPGNLVIHNADKSVHKIVKVPGFINETVIQKRVHPPTSPEGFVYLSKLLEIDGALHLIVGIETYTNSGVRMGPGTMIEERALDIDTGIFHPTWNNAPIYC